MCLSLMKHDNDLIGIYVHIPFCVRKCAYCDFLSFSADEQMHNQYVNSLCKQIDASDKSCRVASIYIGGGTPSVIASELIETILCKLKEGFVILPDAEITIEVNPKTVTKDSLKKYRAMGINRLSIGLQSANNDELKLLGRIHSFEDFLNCYADAKAAGFDNVNIDIITALPGQTKEMLSNTLDKVIELNPEHISAYSLILEEGTPFYDLYGDSQIMSEDDERGLYYLCRDRLIDAGYLQYEISNFAREGYYSRHNTSYWTRRDYLGLGLGASSLIKDHRIKNETDIHKYIKNPLAKCEDITLDKKSKMEEFMFLGLRKMCGVNVLEFESEFDVIYDEIYGEITQKLIDQGVLKRINEFVLITNKGIDYGNYVFSSFLL